MIFHASIPGRHPERVAKVIAELWHGEAFPFIPLAQSGSWVAFAGDARGSSIECYPRGATLSPSTEIYPTGFSVTINEIAAGAADGQSAGVATHIAIATLLSAADVVSIGKREQWLSRPAQRGVFHVIELWLENSVMLEVLPDEFQKEYIASQTLQAWRAGSAALARKQRNLG